MRDYCLKDILLQKDSLHNNAALLNYSSKAAEFPYSCNSNYKKIIQDFISKFGGGGVSIHINR